MSKGCHSRGCEESWGGLLSDSNSRALKTFQGAAPFDTLLKNFFSLEQRENEDVVKFAIRLESQLASIKWQYP